MILNLANFDGFNRQLLMYKLELMNHFPLTVREKLENETNFSADKKEAMRLQSEKKKMDKKNR